MTSQTNSFKRLILKIQKDLKNRNSEEKLAALTKCVSERLDRSASVYYDNLTQNCEYLLSKNPITVLKTISKEFQTEEDDYE